MTCAILSIKGYRDLARTTNDTEEIRHTEDTERVKDEARRTETEKMVCK